VTVDFAELCDALLGRARDGSGRAADTIHGGSDHALRQTVVAIVGGAELSEHESPGEATLQVLAGSVELRAGDDTTPLTAGQYSAIPPARHSLFATTDSVVLLTVVK